MTSLGLQPNSKKIYVYKNEFKQTKMIDTLFWGYMS